MLRLCLSLFLIVFALPAAAQSWCSSSRLNPTEATICNTPVLGDLDWEMNRAYKAVKNNRIKAQQTAWRKGRDACHTNVNCIKAAYTNRLNALRGGSGGGAQTDLRRPWCGSSRMNLTEQTICGDEQLSDLDAALSVIYGDVLARSGDQDQRMWLERDRNPCGDRRQCIVESYVRRLMALGSDLREIGR